MDVERIEWVDSVGEPGWRTLQQLEETRRELVTKLIVSIGQVAGEDETSVTVCLSTGGVTDQYAECMTIPKVAIHSRRRLKL